MLARIAPVAFTHRCARRKRTAQQGRLLQTAVEDIIWRQKQKVDLRSSDSRAMMVSSTGVESGARTWTAIVEDVIDH
jgi:hypothetical protein